MAQQDYATLKVFAAEQGGALIQLRQLTSAQMSTEGGHQRVDLLNEGLGGFSPGSGSVRISLGFAVPVSGLEFPFQQAAANGNFVTMQFGVGAEAYVGTGKVQTESINQSVNAAVEGSVEWEGELKARQ
jgi:hypothetical protein